MPNPEKQEKAALGRVLIISKRAYLAVKNGEEIDNLVALLDGLSATLSHFESDEEPVRVLMKALKRDIKTANKAFYKTARPFFRRFYPIPSFDVERARKHLPAIIYANDAICAKIVLGELDKAKSMCSAMASYPPYIFGEFSALSDSQFYDLVFGYYPKIYDEDFMGEMRYLFE